MCFVDENIDFDPDVAGSLLCSSEQVHGRNVSEDSVEITVFRLSMLKTH